MLLKKKKLQRKRIFLTLLSFHHHLSRVPIFIFAISSRIACQLLPFVYIYNLFYLNNGYTCIHIIIILILLLKIFCHDFQMSKKGEKGKTRIVFCLADLIQSLLFYVNVFLWRETTFKRDFNDNELCPTLHASISIYHTHTTHLFYYIPLHLKKKGYGYSNFKRRKLIIVYTLQIQVQHIKEVMNCFVIVVSQRRGTCIVF